MGLKHRQLAPRRAKKLGADDAVVMVELDWAFRVSRNEVTTPFIPSAVTCGEF